MKYPIVSDCSNCQAIADSRVLFLTIEGIAKRENFAPDRMAKALRDLYAMWQSMATEVMLPDGDQLSANDIDELANAAAEAVRHAFTSTPQGHTH